SSSTSTSTSTSTSISTTSSSTSTSISSSTTIVYGISYCTGSGYQSATCAISGAVSEGSGNNNFYVSGAGSYDYQPWDGVLNWPIFVMDDWTGMGIQGSAATVTTGTETSSNVNNILLAGANVHSTSGWQGFVQTGNGTYGWPNNPDCTPYTATYSYDFTNWASGTPIAVLIMESWGWESDNSYSLPSGCTTLYYSGGGSNPGAVIAKCNQVAGTTYTLGTSFTCHAEFGYIAVAFPYGKFS
ncbi:MAG: hypothetical protein ACP5RP_03885, partial [Candidatus Micrarchaeia archaeon]